MEMIFGYWDIKGIGQIVRISAAHLGVELKEIHPERSTWPQTKHELGLDFPNMPYLIDGDVNITESKAIPIYLAGKAGKPEFLGKTMLDQARVAQVCGVVRI